MTRTDAYLPISAAAYEEIKLALMKADYGHALIATSKGTMLDLCGICLARQPAPAREECK